MVLVLVLAAACSKKAPDRKAWAAAWEKAAKTPDSKAAWELLDKRTRGRLVGGAEKMLGTVKDDPVRRSTLTCLNPNVEMSEAPAQVARALFADWLKTKGASIRDDGTSDQVHLEDGAWRISLEPVGFVDEDGRPLTLSLEQATPALPAAGAGSHDVKFDFVGTTMDQVQAAYASEAARIAKEGKLPAEWAPLAGRVMSCDIKARSSEAQVLEATYHVDGAGAITPMPGEFSGGEIVTSEEPKLEYRPWPDA
jgi:hypothetical protein